MQSLIALIANWRSCGFTFMASITIRKLDESLKSKLRIRAACNNRSMEDEVRNILQTVLADTLPAAGNLGESIHCRFKALGGVDLDLPERKPSRKPPKPGR